MFYLNNQTNNKLLLLLGGIFEFRIQFEFLGDVLKQVTEKWEVVFKHQKQSNIMKNKAYCLYWLYIGHVLSIIRR